jgi:PAS domain S-box-containing protein
VVFHKSTFPDSQGHVLGLIGVILDVTERKRLEDELRKVKEEWEQTFNAVPDLITILGNDHKIIRVNRAMAERLGLNTEDCVGLTCYEAVHGTFAPPASCPHLQLLDDGQEHTVEVHEERLGGDYAVTVTPLLDASGSVFGSVHVARDITDQKSTELRLAEISKMNEQIIANSPVGIAIYQADGQCIVANDAMGEIIGGAKEQVLSQNFRRIKSWQDTKIIDMALKTLDAGFPTSGNISMVSGFGKSLWLSGSFNRFYLRDEPHLLLMFSDLCSK